MYDVIIIGAGVSGAAAARELSRYRLKICVLEREEDVCCGTSKANSGIAHSGYDAEPGSLMAELNVKGSNMMGQLSKELDFPFKQTGSLTVCTTENGIAMLHKLRERGLKNGVEGLRILDREEALAMEPNLSDQVLAALYAPTAGIVCPFELNIAMAENAYNNGVEFKFDTEVKNIRKQENGFVVETSKGDFETGCIVNAAGVYADVFHNMVSEKKLHITPRKGEYMLLDKSAGAHVNHTIFALPNKNGNTDCSWKPFDWAYSYGSGGSGGNSDYLRGGGGSKCQIPENSKGYSTAEGDHKLCRASSYRGRYGFCDRRGGGCSRIYRLCRNRIPGTYQLTGHWLYGC